MSTEASASNGCLICLNILTEPKVLPCGHVICRTCLVTWLQARETATQCPLCRYPILGEVQTPDGFEMRLLAGTVADALPTYLVVKATARDRHDVTPDTCSGCQGLLCSSSSHDTRHLLCSGQQDPHQTSQQVSSSLHLVLSEKLRKMAEQMSVVQACLKATKEKLVGLVPDDEADEMVQAQAVMLVEDVQNQAAQLCTILLTHQHLMEGPCKKVRRL